MARVCTHAGLVYDRVRIGCPKSAPTLNLLFLHALLASRTHWQPFLRHLGRALDAQHLSAEAVLPDCRNHGDSKVRTVFIVF